MVVLSPLTGLFVDRFANRKWPLIIGLVAQITATGLTAAATNIYALCFSRVFQAGAASILWIASLASITDTVGSGNMGKTMGVVGPIIGSGAFLGPMAAGVLLSSVGYWWTWSVAIAMITLDLLLRLAMTERPQRADCGMTTANAKPMRRIEEGNHDTPLAIAPDPKSCSDMAEGHGSKDDQQATQLPEPDPTTPLLPNARSPHSQLSEAAAAVATQPLSNMRYFFLIFRQRRIMASLLLNVIVSATYNSFNTTLALHVEEVFRWGPRQVGLLFLALAGPSVLCGPSVGWVRDSIGVRAPTIFGTGLATLCYVAIGAAASDYGPWKGNLDAAKGIYIGGLVMMGAAIELTAGICIIEGTLVIDGLESRTPGIFGPRGGYARFISLTSMLYPIGSLVGPLLSGSLTVRFSYLVMNLVMASLTFLCFLLAIFFIGSQRQVLDQQEYDRLSEGR
ncbi:MAG: hypothetical protein Q9222_003084 [Ikaeria aurantiellina]